jgi:LPXTG-motif cell wall-anchored protein
MGIMVTKDEDDNVELTRKINADLREKVQRTHIADGEDPDFIADSEYFEQFDKTGRFSWIWFVLIGLALASLVFIILL